MTRKGLQMVTFWILLLVLVVGILVDIGITVLLHVRSHYTWEFLAWLGRRDWARRAWALALVLLLILRYALGVI